MIFSSLELINFKKHRNLQVQFEPGSNLIVGPNYAGKSTILQGLMVCLWGSSANSQTSAEMVSDGEKDYHLTLEFSTGHTLTRTQKNATLSRAGEDPYARGHSAVNKAVAELLGMSRDTFTKVFASTQGSPERLLDMEGAELQKFIEMVIGIEKLDAVAKECNRRVSRCKDQTDALEYLVLSPEAHAEAVAEMAKLESAQEQTSEEMQRIEDQLVWTQGLLGKKEKELKEGVDSNHLLDRYQTQLDALTQQLAGRQLQPEPSIAAFSQAKDAAEQALLEAEAANKRQQQINDRHREYRQQHALLSEELAMLPLEVDLEPITEHRDALEDQYKYTVEEERILDRLSKDAASVSAKLEKCLDALKDTPVIPEGAQERAESALKTQQELTSRKSTLLHSCKSATCPTCKRDMEGVDKGALEAELLQVSTELEAASSRYTEMQSQYLHFQRREQLSQAAKELEEELRRLQVPREPLAWSSETLWGALNAAKTELEAATRSNNRRTLVTNKLDALVKPEGEEHPLLALNELQRAFAKAEQELETAASAMRQVLRENQEVERLQRAIANLERPAVTQRVDTEMLEKQVESYKADTQSLRDKVWSHKDQLHAVSLQVEPLRSKLQAHDKAYEHCKAYFEEADNCRYISQILANSREKFISDAMKVVFGVTTEFCKLGTDGDIEEVLFDGNIRYREQGVLRSRTAASGAQRALIGLGMKLGVANLIRTPLASILLDEAGAAMSDEVSMRAALAMDSLCEQNIAISHRKLDVAGNLIELG